MPHNRYFTPRSFAKTTISLTGDELYHLRKVMRQTVGDTVELINGQGELAKGTITALNSDSALIKISEISSDNKISYELVLILAFIKPSNLELVVEKAVELGVTKILLFPAERSEKKELSDNNKLRLTNIMLSAMKQCGRLSLPRIEYHKNLADCLPTQGPIFFGDPHEKKQQALDFKQEITSSKNFFICIGPEAGFSEKEYALLLSKKAKPIRLHSNVLRAETAAITACYQGYLLLQ